MFITPLVYHIVIYLCNGFQKGAVSGSLSSSKEAITGVPQNSISGATLL